MNRSGAEKKEGVGSQGRVRLLPNGNTLGLCALAVAMWYAGASQTNGAAYLLCFTLVGVTLVSTLHAWANLRGLRVRAGAIRPVFAGEDLCVPLTLEAATGRAHAGIRVRPHRQTWFTPRMPGSDRRYVMAGEVGPADPCRAELIGAPERRGCFSTVPVEISSLFPLGFVTASRRLAVPQVFWVYPKPAGRLPLPRSPAFGREARSGPRGEGDDFAGVRGYRRGDSQRHIDWRAVARGQPMLVKQWAGESELTVRLDWQELNALGPEERLSQLARWILLAERRGVRYSLHLPGVETKPAQGESHMHECLRALAAFPP